jgi:branched-chain amino acid transport system substrate-binding protein
MFLGCLCFVAVNSNKFLVVKAQTLNIVVSQVVPASRSIPIPIVKEYLAAIDISDQTLTYESLEGFIAAKALLKAMRRACKIFASSSLQKNLAFMIDKDVVGLPVNLYDGVTCCTKH